MSFRTEIRTPEGVAFDAEVEGLVLPGVDGLIGVLTGHAPMLTSLKTGVITVRQPGRTVFVVVGDGVVDVRLGSVEVVAGSAVIAASETEADDILTEYLKHIASSVPSVVDSL